MVIHPWPLLEISLSDFRWLATLNINTYLSTYLGVPSNRLSFSDESYATGYDN